MILFVEAGYAQKINWQNLDLIKDTVFGISTERAYVELLKNKKSTQVTVAVIDGGCDTLHEDLKQILWVNRKDILNGIDDDKNGYVDDINGWNFIGGAKGNVQYDNLEITRIVRKNKSFYDSLAYTTVPVMYQKGYQEYRKVKKEFDEKCDNAKRTVEGLGKFKDVIERIVKNMRTDIPSAEDFKNYKSEDEDEKKVCKVMVNQLKSNPDYESFKVKQVDAAYKQFKYKADYQLNINFDPRLIVGDNYNDSRERAYGNNDIQGPNADHGTHVSGIIAAKRNNGLGIDGVADNVKIISIRVVPDGDERDKDVANGILFAVNNGARIINMSFGKPFSPFKKVVDEAVKYAMNKGVLMIHASGNEGKNIDMPENYFFPRRDYDDSSGSAAAWIEVGASGWKDDSTLIAEFSNYGKATVDVFAPGVQIYSTIPFSKYDYHNGTSMAAPVVAGLAALIWQYYPELTALEIKDIIMKSVAKVNHPVMVKDRVGVLQRVLMSDICVSGGIVNAFNALQYAEEYSKNKFTDN